MASQYACRAGAGRSQTVACSAAGAPTDILVNTAGATFPEPAAALELRPAGVRCNAVCPTVVLTEMGQQVWGQREKAAPMLARIPLGRFGVPSDVAGAVVFLASEAAAMINGAEIPLDGGFTVA